MSIRTAPEPTRSLTVLSEHTVFGNAGTHSLSLGISEDYSFVFEIENPTYERKVDSSDGRKAVYIRGDFDIQFTGAASSELNAQAVFWTRGLIDGDALMRVKDEGSGNFSIYVYLLPDNTELFVYWETRATQSGGFDLDADGYPVISDTTLGNPTSTFFDFRGSNAGNVLASGGAIGIRVVPEPASLRLGVAALSVLLLLASRHGNRQARTNRTV